MMASKRKIEEMEKTRVEETEDEVSASEEDEAEEKKTEQEVTFQTLLGKILKNEVPLSETEPGYLLGFVELLNIQDDLPAELENCLLGLEKAGKIWNFNIGKTLKKGALEYIMHCKSLMAGWLGTLFTLTTLRKLKDYLNVYKEMNITEEDCLRYVEKVITSTSPTTASGVTKAVGVAGGKKRKHSEPMLDEIEILVDDIPAEAEDCPTWKVYSSTTARKNGDLYTRKYKDTWKDFHVKITIYRAKDLKNCSSARDKWNYRHQEFDLNYNSGTKIWEKMCQMKALHEEYITSKVGTKWEKKKEYHYE